MRLRLCVAALAALSIANPVQPFGVGRLLELFGRRTVRTPLPEPKNRVGPFVDPGVARVVLIVLENCGPAEAAKQSFLIDRANDGMVLNHYYAVAHPSQPNYIALISGSVIGTNGDYSPMLERTQIGDRLPHRWKVYAEDYPDSGNCSGIRGDGAYVKRHVPFLNFTDVDCSAIVRLNSDRTTRTVSAAPPPLRDPLKVTSALRDDIANGTLPSFALVIPNLEDDGHEPSNVRNANDWLAEYFAPLLDNPSFTKDTVFILTFDEDEHATARRPNRVFAVLWGDHVLHGTDDDVYDHFDMFLTIAALLHVTPLPPTDESDSRPISGIWK